MSKKITDDLWKEVLEDVEEVYLDIVAYFQGIHHLLFKGHGEKFHVSVQASGDQDYIMSLESLGMVIDEKGRSKLLGDFRKYSIVKVKDNQGYVYEYWCEDEEV